MLFGVNMCGSFCVDLALILHIVHHQFQLMLFACYYCEPQTLIQRAQQQCVHRCVCVFVCNCITLDSVLFNHTLEDEFS